MPHYDRIDVSEGTDLAKSNNSKKCTICHYCFLIIVLNFRIIYATVVMVSCLSTSNMSCLNTSNITIITVKNVNFRCIIHNISKSKAIIC